MLSKGILILDLDGSITRQYKLVSEYDAEIADLKDIGPAARFWMNGSTRREIRSRLDKFPKDRLTFLGSGDFHHLSSILIERFEEPVSVIDFDFHPDMNLFSVRLNCGSWVVDALKKENVRKFVIIGASSRDISTFLIDTMALGYFKDDRVELYPYSHRPSFVFLHKVHENISIETKHYPFAAEISWNELKKKNLAEFLLHIIRRLPTKKVYVSIDKDCLKRDFAITNWEEGELTLEELSFMLKLIKDNLEIVGADVTGDYSDIRLNGFVKGIVSSLDHPARDKPEAISREKTDEVNEATNLKLAELLIP